MEGLKGMGMAFPGTIRGVVSLLGLGAVEKLLLAVAQAMLFHLFACTFGCGPRYLMVPCQSNGPNGEERCPKAPSIPSGCSAAYPS